ncbi:MAG TPA: MAPEG family protein [bacterium]|nr:MAPEG family protein [bacterium]
MNIPFLCVALAFLLLYLTKIPLAVAMGRSRGGYDNRHPRDQQAALEGWGRRALAAHQNAFEAFAPFAAAVLVAHAAGADPVWSARLALLFIAARIVYTCLYLANQASLRSTVWMIGTLCTAGLFYLAIFR